MKSSCSRHSRMLVAETRRDTTENCDITLIAKSMSSSSVTLCHTTYHITMSLNNNGNYIENLPSVSAIQQQQRCANHNLLDVPHKTLCAVHHIWNTWISPTDFILLYTAVQLNPIYFYFRFKPQTTDCPTFPASLQSRDSFPKILKEKLIAGFLWAQCQLLSPDHAANLK